MVLMEMDLIPEWKITWKQFKNYPSHIRRIKSIKPKEIKNQIDFHLKVKSIWEFDFTVIFRKQDIEELKNLLKIYSHEVE